MSIIFEHVFTQMTIDFFYHQDDVIVWGLIIDQVLYLAFFATIVDQPYFDIVVTIINFAMMMPHILL